MRRRGLLFIGVLCAATTSYAATIPNAPTPNAVRPVDRALYAADVTLRTLDITSTHALLNNPCGCFYERDVLSPGGKGIAPLMTFQYGTASAVILGSRYLRHHHHTRIARALVIADIVSESIAVGKNLSLSAPHTTAKKFTSITHK